MEWEQSEIVGGGGKLLRTGANEYEWNGVVLILANELNEDLISVSRWRVIQWRSQGDQGGHGPHKLLVNVFLQWIDVVTSFASEM